MAAAVKLLRSKDRLEAEVLRALASFDADTIDSVVCDLRSRRFLNDERVIAEHIERRVRQGKGLPLIEAELLSRGAAEGDVSKAMQAVIDQETERATVIARELRAKSIDLRKVGRALASRGFEEATISAALDRLDWDE